MYSGRLANESVKKKKQVWEMRLQLFARVTQEKEAERRRVWE